MADKDVVRISFRLNLQNEQHQRIYRVLAALDKDIHKSTNQFIANAVDFYGRDPHDHKTAYLHTDGRVQQ